MSSRLRALGLLSVLLCACGTEPPRNLVLIVVDTLRADHLGLYGYARNTSPRLDAWAERGVVFEQALATSPWTVPSFASIYTGQLPSRHGALRQRTRAAQRGVSVGRLDVSVRTLAEILAEQGFATAAFINNPFLHGKGGLARGFETYDRHPSNNWKLRRAGDVVDAALRWLDEPRERRFLLVVHLFDPHLDYDPPEPYRRRFAPDYDGGLQYPVNDLNRIRSEDVAQSRNDREFIAAAYDEEILYTDAQVGRLLDSIAERGRLQDTVVTLVADHGEELFDHGAFEHGHSMYQELLRVPLVMWAPGVGGSRVTQAVSIADVLPTALEALALPAQTGLFGQSLWGALRGGELPGARVLIAENTLKGKERKALLRWPHKLTLEVASGAVALFDLGQDPAERSDLVGERPEVRDRLLTVLKASVKEAERARTGADAAEFPSDVIRSLEELGYLEGDAR